MKNFFITIVLLLFTLITYGQEGEKSTAILAGGCFWCMQPPYDKLPGVIDTEVGYAGGKLENPTYTDVSSGRTQHLEVVKIIYDPQKVSFEKLLDVFWKNIDPTDRGGQFCDRGHQYTTAIFLQSQGQRLIAEKSKAAIIKSGKVPLVVTKILPANRFYPAEQYHQDYYKKNPFRYMVYRLGCGRDARLRELWGG